MRHVKNVALKPRLIVNTVYDHRGVLTWTYT